MDAVMNAIEPVEFSLSEVCERIRKGLLELLSESGSLSIHDELKHQALLLSDESLVVATDSVTNPLLLDYTNHLDREGVVYRLQRVQLSDISQIRKAWESSGGKSNISDIAKRQQEMVRLIERAVSLRASDIHIVADGEAEGDVCWVYIRVDGDKLLLNEDTGQHGFALMRAAYQTMTGTAQQSFHVHEPQDASLKSDFVRRLGLYGARLATRPRAPGLMMVMRLLYDSMGQDEMTLESLGYPDDQVEQIRRFAQIPYGVVIFTGPTGSGKSMVMKCSLEHRIEYFEHAIHVLTLEDPPEYRIRGAEQTPLSKHGDWAADIKNMMRLDPDTAMIGEMRDLVSAQAAFRAAETGHGIWTTLHANNVTAAINRLDNLGIERSWLMDPTLMRGIVSQNLVQRLCPHCSLTNRELKSLPRDIRIRLEQHGLYESARFRNPKGCAHCGDKGIIGRMPIAEILQPSIGFFDVYMREGTTAARRYWMTEMGGISKTQRLIERIRDGSVDPRNGERVVGPLNDDELTLGKSLVPAVSRGAA